MCEAEMMLWMNAFASILFDDKGIVKQVHFVNMAPQTRNPLCKFKNNDGLPLGEVSSAEVEEEFTKSRGNTTSFTCKKKIEKP